MIELRAFGPISLKHTDGSDIGPLLAQPKRLALTAYLAAPPPHGGRCFHRKDTLVAMFWPELDQQRARASLRNSLYFLREALGAAVVVARGEEEIGLDHDALWCDVDAFDLAFRTRDFDSAINLYRGELLDGVFVSGAQPFEEWLDVQRARRRTEAQEAASQAARRHAVAGRLGEALEWARRAQSMAPLNEHATRTVISLLYLLDDRAGALREHQRFAALLREEHGIAPSQETQRLVDAIRAPEKHAVATSLAMAQMPWLRFAAGPLEAAAGLYDRSVLEAFVQKRLGLMRRGTGKVGLILVRLEVDGTPGVRRPERDTDRALRNLSRAVVECVRDADLVAFVEPGTLVVLPAAGAPEEVVALVKRLRGHLDTNAKKSWPSPTAGRPDVTMAWLDPKAIKSAGAALSDAVSLAPPPAAPAKVPV